MFKNTVNRKGECSYDFNDQIPLMNQLSYEILEYLFCSLVRLLNGKNAPMPVICFIITHHFTNKLKGNNASIDLSCKASKYCNYVQHLGLIANILVPNISCLAINCNIKSYNINLTVFAEHLQIPLLSTLL